MGNSRFKFSDMIPNAWLYKLKDMAKPKNTENTQHPSKSKQQPHHFNHRKYYHFTRDLVPLNGFYVPPDPPRKSPKKPYYSRRRNFRSTGCSCNETADSPLDYSASSSSLSSSYDGSPSESSDVDAEKIDEMPKFELPPIITKPAKFNDMKTKRNNKDKNMSPVRKFSVGVRLRTHSPRIGSRRLIQGHGRESVSSTSSSSSSRRSALSESLAVVKSSIDPERDFRESMLEMIVENNIRTSKELEELLASYLSLNSDENHQLIIKVFKQIWFDLNHVHFKY